jgi:carotenoid cleavage dioxygenase-like enzyme
MSVAAPALPDLAPHLEGCVWLDPVEASYEVSGVSGRVPEWLRGSWYVNGPSRFERGWMRYKHSLQALTGRRWHGKCTPAY